MIIEERFGINDKSLWGESRSADPERVRTCKDVLRNIIDSYGREDVFNANETILNYRTMLSKTLAWKNKKFME